jgi:hypothetical protein
MGVTGVIEELSVSAKKLSARSHQLSGKTGTNHSPSVSFHSNLNEMTALTKRLVWALALAMLLLVAVVGVIYLCGVPAFITSFLNRPVTEPSVEDYAVYSAFVDDFLSSNQPFRADQGISPDSVVYVVDETLPLRSPGTVLPLAVAALGPSYMGDDFFRQNSQTCRLHPLFHSRRTISLVGSGMAHRAASFGMEQLFEPPKKTDGLRWLPHASPMGPFPEDPQVSGALQLSRLGFNRRKTLALLYYSYRCGALCGQSGWVVLHKASGTWAVKEFGSAVVY